MIQHGSQSNKGVKPWLSGLKLLLVISSLFNVVDSFTTGNSMIQRSFTRSSTREELEDLKVTDLKDQLRDMGLKVGGKKSDLIDRIISNQISEETAETPVIVEDEPEIQEPEMEEEEFDGEGLSEEEKELITTSVFNAHGFIPDLRTNAELPRSVRKMRQQPKSKRELDKLKARYSSMNESDQAYNILIDLGLLEDYSKYGEYTDDDEE